MIPNLSVHPLGEYDIMPEMMQSIYIMPKNILVICVFYGLFLMNPLKKYLKVFVYVTNIPGGSDRFRGSNTEGSVLIKTTIPLGVRSCSLLSIDKNQVSTDKYLEFFAGYII